MHHLNFFEHCLGSPSHPKFEILNSFKSLIKPSIVYPTLSSPLNPTRCLALFKERTFQRDPLTFPPCDELQYNGPCWLLFNNPLLLLIETTTCSPSSHPIWNETITLDLVFQGSPQLFIYLSHSQFSRIKELFLAQEEYGQALGPTKSFSLARYIFLWLS